MGLYLNPGCEGFKEALNSEIYVDKSRLIEYTNRVFATQQKNICISRPRRFGKSMTAKMLVAYYGKGCDADKLFHGLEVAKTADYARHLNRYPVLFLNMQTFLSEAHSVSQMLDNLKKALKNELSDEYGIDVETPLPEMLMEIFQKNGQKIVIIIDEWDCVFREKKTDDAEYVAYLDFLRNLLKDRDYVGLAYMTGILPIKKYGTHSALNMFSEFSMTNPRVLGEYVGFTADEVKTLCDRYHMDYDGAARWYDGYTFRKAGHVYSPKSVVDAMLNEEYDSYWSQTESYEALRVYIDMNYDILTLLVHLGYLAYDIDSESVYIPNYEVGREFRTSIQGAGWKPVIEAIEHSDKLLRDTWAGDGA